MLEIAKILVSLLGGGLAGAILREWYSRRRSRVQPIPLIERVNRVVSPGLEGFTLARLVGNPKGRELEEVTNLREYQLTMRNTSSIHLRDAEVQFEFPADDVQAWASRPALSKTALEALDASATEPWKKAFRWKIPHLPSGDSVEFTFQAVRPSSENYEAALYRCEGVVFERVVGEPPPRNKQRIANIVFAVTMTLLFTALGILVTKLGTSGERLTTVSSAGCDLQVISLYDRYGQDWNSPWRIKQRVLNVGSQDCVFKSEKINVLNLSTIKPGEVLEREKLSEDAAKLLDVEISVGVSSSSLRTTTIPVYVGR
jgi:hypothetical protein